MKTKKISPIGLSITGAGPKIMRPMFLILIIGIIVQLFFPAVSKFPFLTESTLKNAGWILAITGLVFWILAIVQFAVGFPKGKLITTGIYSLSRNPIYASWIVFILPGLAGICNNWIFLLASLAMYISLVINIKEEEKSLAETFGKEYDQYVKRVGRVLFFPPIF